MLSHFHDSVHQFLECDFIFANVNATMFIILKKYFSSYKMLSITENKKEVTLNVNIYTTYLN